MSDNVNHPSHYTFGKYEVADVLDDWFPGEPLLWQVGKYIARAGHKANRLEDLRKACWYLNREIERSAPKEAAKELFSAQTKELFGTQIPPESVILGIIRQDEIGVALRESLRALEGLVAAKDLSSTLIPRENIREADK